tara:strand:- start:899 stop:1123 length:225 start_codon:yes stop_codon:yes gene_type:complete
VEKIWGAPQRNDAAMEMRAASACGLAAVHTYVLTIGRILRFDDPLQGFLLVRRRFSYATHAIVAHAFRAGDILF